VEERDVEQGIWPQCKVNCLQSASTSMQQLLACALQEVMDGALSNAILEVSVHATEGELLVCVLTCLLEGFVGKFPIVAVTMLNFYALLGDKL
jgi:hypothetical protein